jgi:choline dehydrogenase-like flavoprotein
VLANRLSQDGTRRVLLLEAGEAYRPNLYPPDLANTDVAGGHDWGYTAPPAWPAARSGPCTARCSAARLP